MRRLSEIALPQALLLVFALSAWASFAGPWAVPLLVEFDPKAPYFTELEVWSTRCGLLVLALLALLLLVGLVRMARREGEPVANLRVLCSLGLIPFALVVLLTAQLPAITAWILVQDGDQAETREDRLERYVRAVNVSPDTTVPALRQRLTSLETRHCALVALWRGSQLVASAEPDLALPEYPYRVGNVAYRRTTLEGHWGDPDRMIFFFVFKEKRACQHIRGPGFEHHRYCEEGARLAEEWFQGAAKLRDQPRS